MEMFKTREELEGATDQAVARWKERYGDRWQKKLEAVNFAVDEIAWVTRTCGQVICMSLVEKILKDAGTGPLTEEDQEAVDGYLLMVRKYQGRLT